MLTPNSATLIHQMWGRYAAQYEQKTGKRPTMRSVSLQIGLDGSALARWSNAAAPLKRRIPLSQVAPLCRALLASAAEQDALMEARLLELPPDSEVAAACLWLADFLARDVSSQEETAVLDAFAKARMQYPRGLYFDADESRLLSEAFAPVLARAARLAEEETTAEAISPASREEAHAVTVHLRSLMLAQRQGRSVFRQALEEAVECRSSAS